jgi:DNA ligase-1
MLYEEFVEVYDALGSTSKRLEKEEILAGFLKKLAKKGNSEWIYLLRGKVTPDWDPKEFGISNQLVIKAIGISSGVKNEKIVSEFRKIGDLGEVAEKFIGKKTQGTLFSGKLKVRNVFENLKKVMGIEGKGAVGRKMDLVSELFSNSTGKEAKYLVRTLLNDLRIGVADGTLRQGIAEAFFEDEKKEMSDLIESKYDLVNDLKVILEASVRGKKALEKLEIHPGKPIKVMLPVKVTEISEAFRIVGKPAAIEHKYDGFRMLINKNEGEISLFTRKLENVTSQFPDVIEAVKKIKADSFILDTEVVGWTEINGKKKYMPFEAISQRIKRKYDIDKLIKKLPVEINVFDIVYLNGEILIDKVFSERRKVLGKLIKRKENVIRTSEQIQTSDELEAKRFYEKALEIGEEGVMFKALDKGYRQGRRVGYIVKMKPEVRDLDLVITGAEYGTGKRGGLLTSYIVACRSEKNGKVDFLEVGKVASGLKEKEQEKSGEFTTTYREMNDLLKPLILEDKGRYVRVKPKIVVSVTYQNMQKSPSYDSGLALRFPRITAYRPEKPLDEISTLKELEKEAGKGR